MVCVNNKTSYICYEINKCSLNRLLEYIKQVIDIIRQNNSQCKKHDILICKSNNTNEIVYVSIIEGKNTERSLGKIRTILDTSNNVLSKVEILAILKCENASIICKYASSETKDFINNNWNTRFKTFLIQHDKF